ncbi:SDR family NAD(P)-dependent oxidoreductase [Streptomyces atratus]|uniref:SDR family NAD(P)-dependent oxidoreductase n=1 Tax=Streptomyces atratus TaxID=1893 RepID=UPI0033EF1C98
MRIEGSDIGAEICRVLTSLGATVVADRAPAGTYTGGADDYRELGVADERAVERAFDDLVAAHGRIDGLVDNAGITGPIKPAHEATEKEFDAFFAVNVKGTWLCTKHPVRHMLPACSGSIIGARFATGTELVVDGGYTAVRAVTPRSCLRAPTTGRTTSKTVRRGSTSTSGDRRGDTPSNRWTSDSG